MSMPLLLFIQSNACVPSMPIANAYYH
uniref:Uncharacterized protein n=1 Tax=Rhizophora mucronata TaxID=61149 RepID=A0A2P2PAQ4_RHIMU